MYKILTMISKDKTMEINGCKFPIMMTKLPLLLFKFIKHYYPRPEPINEIKLP